MKTRKYPMLTTMKRYNEWGIKLDIPFRMQENAARRVKYASEQELFEIVMLYYPQKHDNTDFPPMPANEDEPGSRTRRQISDDLIN